nr:hypothetical protein [Tanacetum cinerariifolium]
LVGGHRGGARHPERRWRPVCGGWRGKYDPRAVCHVQAFEGLRHRLPDARFQLRLALHQPRDAGPVWHRRDGRNRRKPSGPVPHQPRRPGQIC